MRIELSSRTLVILAALGAGLWLLTVIWPVALMVISGLVFATALTPLVTWLERRGVGRVSAVIGLTALLLGAVLLVGLLLAPVLYAQAQHLATQLPERRAALAQFLAANGANDLADDVRRADPRVLVQPRTAANLAVDLLGGIVTAGTIVVLTAYILIDADRIESLIYLVTPADYHTHLRHLLAALGDVVGGYMGGQLVTSLAIMLYTFVVLAALGIPEPLALAVFAGIADVIPIAGTFLAVVPPVLVALTLSVPRAVAVAVALMLYRELENSVLLPRVYGKRLRLPGVAVLTAVLIGTQVGGVAGAFFSLPAAAALRAIILCVHEVRAGRPAESLATGAGAVAPDGPVLKPGRQETAPSPD
jgi:predicted PurR-regulated permease PerM